MSSDPVLAYQNESLLDSDDGRPYGDSLIPEETPTLQSACASCAFGKVGFPTALNAFTALLAYRMQTRKRSALCPVLVPSGLLGRGSLDWEDSVR